MKEGYLWRWKCLDLDQVKSASWLRPRTLHLQDATTVANQAEGTQDLSYFILCTQTEK